MANISANCIVSLPKKLRAILGKGERCSVILTAEVIDGKGVGRLSFDSEQFSAAPEGIVSIGETSIIITPSDLADETPSHDSKTHATIFSTVPGKNESSPVIDKLAAVHPPSKGEESHAIVAKEDIKTPDVFSVAKEEDCKNWISNMEELIDAVSGARGKRSEIDIDMAHNDRERALLRELKEKDEAIDAPAWIINSGGGTLVINDLEITLPINAPYDLSNISARRIIMSRDLKQLIKGGYIKFLSPAQKDQYVLEKSGEKIDMGLAVYDSPAEAEAGIADSVSQNPAIDEENSIEISEKDIESPTEDESMVLNLTQEMPKTKSNQAVIPEETSRHTVHGTPSPSGKTNSPNVNPIRKLT